MPGRKVLLAVIAGLLVVGLLGLGGLALAQGKVGDPSTAVPGLRFGWGGKLGGGHGNLFLNSVAKAIGMNVADVVAEWSGQGKTLRQVIVAHGGDPDVIAQSFVAANKAVLDASVANGWMTQDQETQQLANLKTQVTAELDRAQASGARTGKGPLQGRERGVAGAEGASLLGIISDTVKVPAADLAAEWAKGKTLREVITAHQGDPEKVVSTFVAARKVAWDKAVTAGTMTQADEDLAVKNLTTMVRAQLDLVGGGRLAVPGCGGMGLFGRGFGGMRPGFGGMRPGRGSLPSAPAATPSAGRGRFLGMGSGT
jgi:hypothetical protein